MSFFSSIITTINNLSLRICYENVMGITLKIIIHTREDNNYLSMRQQSFSKKKKKYETTKSLIWTIHFLFFKIKCILLFLTTMLNR